MIFLYNTIFLCILFIFSPLIFFYLISKGKINYLKDYFCLYKKKTDRSVLFHCVSVGECNSILKVADKVRCNVIISTTCEEAIEFIKNKRPNWNAVFYPVDISFIVKSFLKKNKIKKVIISEVDYWPSLFFECNKLGIDILILNGRISNKTFNFMKNFLYLYKSMFQGVKKVYIQNKDQGERFSKFIDKDRIEYRGNLKFDIVRKKNRSNSRKIIITAGSIHTPEEDYILDIFNNVENIILYLVPRNLDEISKIKSKCIKRNLNFSLYSEKRDTDIIIVDIYGVLSEIYTISDIAYIGGGFKKTGVHNFIEALSCKIPVVIGPNTLNFTNEFNMLKKTGALFKVNKLEDISKSIENLTIEDRNKYKNKIQEYLNKNIPDIDTIIEEVNSGV